MVGSFCDFWNFIAFIEHDSEQTKRDLVSYKLVTEGPNTTIYGQTPPFPVQQAHQWSPQSSPEATTDVKGPRGDTYLSQSNTR